MASTGSVLLTRLLRQRCCSVCRSGGEVALQLIHLRVGMIPGVGETAFVELSQVWLHIGMVK